MANRRTDFATHRSMPAGALPVLRRAALLAALLSAGTAAATTGSGAKGASPILCPFLVDGFEPVVQGTLTQPAGDGTPIGYVTSGGYTIDIDHHTIRITDPLGLNHIEHWGDPHENLRGKHLKDWEGTRRSVLLMDGTHITMDATGPQGVVVLTSIYDGHHNVQVDNAVNLVVHEAAELADTLCRERAQHDGETARFSTSIETGVAHYTQVYQEDESFERTPDTTPLGSTGGFANPNQTNDFYDDPRLGHT